MEGLTVLIADSNAYMRRLTRMMLTNLGVKAIYEATDGVSALDAIATSSPDVMILDWGMPVLDGCEVMRIVRSPGKASEGQPADHHADRSRVAVAGDRGDPRSAPTRCWSSRSRRRRCSSACSASCSTRGRWCAPASSSSRCRAAASTSTNSSSRLERYAFSFSSASALPCASFSISVGEERDLVEELAALGVGRVGIIDREHDAVDTERLQRGDERRLGEDAAGRDPDLIGVSAA